MNHLKTKVKFVAIALSITVAATSVHAVIPTTDGIAAGQRAASLAVLGVQATAAGLSVINQEIQIGYNLKKMLDGAKLLEANTGNTINILLPDDGMDKLNRFIPDDSKYVDIYEAYNNNDLGTLEAVYNNVLATETGLRQSSTTGKERLAIALMLNKAQTQEIMASLNERRAKYNELAALLGSTETTAEKSDLLNRLVVEQTMMKADMDRMEIALEIGRQNQELARYHAMEESRASMLK